MKLKVDEINLLMIRAARKAYEHAKIPLLPDEEPNLRRIFCFTADDVAEIYTCKKNVGTGVWFRLKDGRVFDKLGNVSGYDAALYGNG